MHRRKKTMSGTATAAPSSAVFSGSGVPLQATGRNEKKNEKKMSNFIQEHAMLSSGWILYLYSFISENREQWYWFDSAM
jgi:hypothetical protein